MKEKLKFDYYYGLEAEQFSFYRVPRLLVKDPRFRSLSSDAKLLYGLMLDRMSLSMRNGWVDEEDRAYIYYTIDQIMEDLGCARATCVKIISELDSKKGIGLIEKKRQGLGKPDMIYVKNFASLQQEPEEMELQREAETVPNPPKTTKKGEERELNFQKFKNYTSGSSETETPEVQKLNFWKYKKQTSGNSDSERPEVQDLNPNYTKFNQTENSYTQSVNQSESTSGQVVQKFQNGDGWIDRPEHETMDQMQSYEAEEIMARIHDNIDYEILMQSRVPGERELVEEIYQLICDVVCVRRERIRIGSVDYPYELVRKKFLKLNMSHVQYVMERMKQTNTPISNIRAYIMTALYNAPNTINYYYQQEVQHDMHSGKWINQEEPVRGQPESMNGRRDT